MHLAHWLALPGLVLAPPVVAQVAADTQSDKAGTSQSDIIVNGQVEHERAADGALGTRTIIDTPFSIKAVTAEEIADRQVKSLARVFSQDASVVANGDTYTFNSYSQTVRGIPLDDYNSYRINGDPFYMTTVELPLESFETVQLLKGASGFLYGFNAPGGLIDYRTKRSTPDASASADLGFSSDTIVSQHVDLGGPIGAGIGYRLNATHERGETYSGSHVLRYSGSLALDAHLTDDLLWTGDVIYQDRRIRGGTQDFYITDPDAYDAHHLPRPVSGRTDLAAYPDLFFNSHVFYGGTGLRWSASPNWTVRADYSNSLDWRSYKSEWMSLTNPAGEYQPLLSTNPRSWSRYNQVQLSIEGRFATGAVQHQLTLGGSWQGLNKHLPLSRVSTLVGTENLYEPVVPIAYPTGFTGGVYHNYQSTQRGVFASDTLTLGTVSLIAGARVTRFSEDQLSKAGARTNYTKTPVTPVAALLYHPWPAATLYISYVQALESGTTVPDTYANANETLPPIRSQQVEAGIKLERARWSLSAAAYRIARGAQYPSAANVYVSDGEQRYEGIEADACVALPLGLSITDSIAIERAAYRKTDPLLQGKAVEGVPGLKDTVQLTEQLVALPALKATLEAQHATSLWGNDVNSFRVPALTLVNARLSYVIDAGGTPVTLRAEVDNLADRASWGFLGSGYVFVQPPRTVLLNATVRI
jgi:iron complex outermembrane receptor protein